VEAGELSGPGTDYFLKRALSPVLDRADSPTRILLGCTHFPLLLPALRPLIPAGIEILDQGALVATRFADWLLRHPEHEEKLARTGTCRFATTDDPVWFATRGERLLGRSFVAERARLRPIR
jgi:glutamate racemase